jgi:imidazolonepropionase-like amidohydrolase
VDAPPELIQAIADQGIVVGATIGMAPLRGAPGGPGMAPPPEVLARLPKMIANIRRLHEAGAVIVAGTDAGIAPIKPPDVVRYAPAMMGQVGIGAREALRAVTSVAAQVCGLGHRKGRIAPGFDADLLAVDGDPLADLAALHRIRAVYTRGVPVPGAGPSSPVPRPAR